MSAREREIVDRALAIVGTGYRHLGRDFRGYDCIGVALHAYGLSDGDLEACQHAKAAGAAYYATRKWWKDRDAIAAQCHFLIDGLTKHLLPSNLGEIRPGDIITMRFKSVNKVIADHVAVYVGLDEIVHADARRGVTVDRLSGLKDRVVNVYTGR